MTGWTPGRLPLLLSQASLSALPATILQPFSAGPKPGSQGRGDAEALLPTCRPKRSWSEGSPPRHPQTPCPEPGRVPAPTPALTQRSIRHTPSAAAHSQRSGLYINTTALTRPLAAGGGVLGALGLSGVVVSVGDVLFGRCVRVDPVAGHAQVKIPPTYDEVLTRDVPAPPTRSRLVCSRPFLQKKGGSRF